MKIKINKKVKRESKYKLGDVFSVDKSNYILFKEYSVNDETYKYILRQCEDDNIFGCNGFHNTIEELISNLDYNELNWTHYSQDDYYLTLTKK